MWDGVKSCWSCEGQLGSLFADRLNVLVEEGVLLVRRTVFHLDIGVLDRIESLVNLGAWSLSRGVSTSCLAQSS